MKNIIKGAGKYDNGILTIITEDTLYDFCLSSREYGYRTLGDHWHCGGKVTPEALEELRGQCNKYYIFDTVSFEVVERREIK